MQFDVDVEFDALHHTTIPCNVCDSIKEEQEKVVEEFFYLILLL